MTDDRNISYQYIAMKPVRVSAFPRADCPVDAESWSHRAGVLPVFESEEMAEQFADEAAVITVEEDAFGDGP